MECLLYCSKNEYLAKTFVYGSVNFIEIYKMFTIYEMTIPLATSGQHS